MITVYVNGTTHQFEKALNIQELLFNLKITPTPASQKIKGLAVAINNEVIPFSQHPKVQIKTDDRIEIIHPVGGG